MVPRVWGAGEFPGCAAGKGMRAADLRHKFLKEAQEFCVLALEAHCLRVVCRNLPLSIGKSRSQVVSGCVLQRKLADGTGGLGQFQGAKRSGICGRHIPSTVASPHFVKQRWHTQSIVLGLESRIRVPLVHSTSYLVGSITRTTRGLISHRSRSSLPFRSLPLPNAVPGRHS
jgi:hypothetical protein